MRCHQHFLVRLSGNVTLIVLKNDGEYAYDWAELRKYCKADTFALGKNLRWHQNAEPLHIKLGVSSSGLLTSNYFIDDDSDIDTVYSVRYVGATPDEWQSIKPYEPVRLKAPSITKVKNQ